MVPVPVHQVVEEFLDGQGPSTGKKRYSHSCATICIGEMRVLQEEVLVLVSQKSVSSRKDSPGQLEVLEWHGHVVWNPVV